MSGPRVAICSAAVGCGHTRAALAVHDAIRRTCPEATVEIIEALDHAPGAFTRLYRDAYLRLVRHAPRLTGRMYDRSDHPRIHSGLAARIERRALQRLVDHPSIRSADVVLCTHFLCGRVLGDARRRGALAGQLAVCITDQHPHAVWLAPGIDALLVASPAAARVALAAGFQAQQIHAGGIPVHPRFGRAGTAESARRSLGLPLDRPIVLVTGGGLGLGGMESAVASLLASRPRAHVVAVCGRCEPLRASLSRFQQAPGAATAGCTVLGFTNQMPELMAAATLLLGKPGGLTTAEALASELPMVLMSPIPGQEERNARMLVESGVAVLEHAPDRAGQAAAALATDRPRLQSMRDAARRIGRPDAALEIARQVLLMARGHEMPTAHRPAPDVLHAAIEPDLAMACIPCIMG